MSLATRAVYPTQPEALRQTLDGLLASAAPATDIPEGSLVGLIVPDSNRTSGGETAAAAYGLLKGAALDTVLIVSPSHNGAFGRLSICQTDGYHTTLGEVPINDHLRNELCDEDDDIFLDDTGHYHTEGADVQLPFLQRVLGDGFDAVPIVMGEEDPAYCRELGAAVGEVMYGKRALVVGSCDLLRGDADGFRAAPDRHRGAERERADALAGLRDGPGRGHGRAHHHPDRRPATRRRHGPGAGAGAPRRWGAGRPSRGPVAQLA